MIKHEEIASSFIDMIIREYQEHLEKGNTTLGSLPNDWKQELEAILSEAYDYHN